jgi:protein-tyrosine phosphatase
MIDTHCHLLPGLDDGPATLGDALLLATVLADAGVTHVVCTPHWSRQYPTEHAAAQRQLGRLRDALGAAGIPLELGLGAEIGPATLVAASAEALAERRIGGYLLVELVTDTPLGFLDIALDAAATVGARPIFAHPERCAAVCRHPETLEAARSAGALSQVTATCLAGRFGPAVEAFAWELVATGGADLVASDAHRVSPRGLHLVRAAQLIEERFGRRARVELTERVPALVVGGMSSW